MGQIRIGIDGNSFTWNGEPRQLRMRTSFGVTRALLEENLDRVKRWLERCKGLGFDGIRVFGEADIWDGLYYFRHSTREQVWPRRVTGSALVVSDANKRMVESLVGLLEKADMIAEYCVIATLKGGWTEDDAFGVGFVGHALRATSEYLAENRFTNLLPEAINEFDAHNFEWGNEIANFARRWRTRDYPGSLLGISMGGQWSIEYPVGGAGGYSHVNVHPDRHGTWWVIPEEAKRRLNKYGVPVYLNELIHHMTQEQWDRWVPIIPKWGGLSTTNVPNYIDFLTGIQEQGWSFCVHDLTGQESDPDWPVTDLERAFAEEFGGSVNPPKHFAYRHIIEKAYREILLREPDPAGLEGYNVAMKFGATEADVREALIRSAEFKERFKVNGNP